MILGYPSMISEEELEIDNTGYLVQRPSATNCAVISLFNALIYYKKFDLLNRNNIEKYIADKFPPLGNNGEYTTQQLFLIADYLGLKLNTYCNEIKITIEDLRIPLIVTTTYTYLDYFNAKNMINPSYLVKRELTTIYSPLEKNHHSFFVSSIKKHKKSTLWLTSNFFPGTVWVNKNICRGITYFKVDLK